MTLLPKVSCICPTFSRTYLLEEAIESFLRQDYQGEKELIVCNDFTKQEFFFEHPQVKIINLPKRASNLGEKRNLTYGFATGDWFLTWGDDDIHLPQRISRMMNSAISFNSEFVFEGPFYTIYNNHLSYKPNKTCGANIVSRKLFYEVGGIPHINTGEDAAFNEVVRKKIRVLPICTDKPQFIYRWSSGRAHISQFAAETKSKKNDWDLMLEMAEGYVSKGIEPSGLINLNPHWKKDWVKEVENIIENAEKKELVSNNNISNTKTIKMENSDFGSSKTMKKPSNNFNLDSKKLKSTLHKNLRRR